jgi:hypothetical protein
MIEPIAASLGKTSPAKSWFQRGFLRPGFSSSPEEVAMLLPRPTESSSIGKSPSEERLPLSLDELDSDRVNHLGVAGRAFYDSGGAGGHPKFVGNDRCWLCPLGLLSNNAEDELDSGPDGFHSYHVGDDPEIDKSCFNHSIVVGAHPNSFGGVVDFARAF